MSVNRNLNKFYILIMVGLSLVGICKFKNGNIQNAEAKIIQENTNLAKDMNLYRQEKKSIFTNEYENYNYKYKVSIPSGLQGISSPPPMPQHGFVVKLSPDENNELSVDGSYNASNWKSLEEAFLEEFNTKNTNYRELISKEYVLLDKHKAVSFTVKYEDSNNGKIRKLNEIISLRKCGNEDPEVVYIINLNTDENLFDKYYPVMEKIISSWRMSSCD